MFDISTEVMNLIVALGALIIAAIVLFQRRQPITLQSATEELKTATALATDLSEVALTGARAAEQMARDGQITQDERFQHAFDHVQDWAAKYGIDLDEDATVNAVESAVLVVNALVSALPKKAIVSATVNDGDDEGQP